MSWAGVAFRWDAQRCVRDVGYRCWVARPPSLSLGLDDPQHPETIGESIQVAATVNPLPFETRDFHDLESRLGYPDVDQHLYLEAVTPLHSGSVRCAHPPGIEVEYIKAVSPKGVV